MNNCPQTTEAVKAMAENVSEQKPRFVLLGEQHRERLTDETVFLNFLLESAKALASEYKILFVEYLAEFQNELNKYLAGDITLEAYRAKGSGENALSRQQPEAFFEGLRELKQNYKFQICAMNVNGNSREPQMAQFVLDRSAEAKALIWCGMAHAASRPVHKRREWRSMRELIESQGIATYSIFELSRKLLLNRMFDLRLEELLGEVQIAFIPTRELGENPEIVIQTLYQTLPFQV